MSMPTELKEFEKEVQQKAAAGVIGAAVLLALFRQIDSECGTQDARLRLVMPIIVTVCICALLVVTKLLFF